MLKFLSLLGVDIADYNHWELFSQAGWYSASAAFFALFVGAVILWFGYRSTDRLKKRPLRRLLIVALRSAAIIAALVVIFEPALRLGKVSKMSSSIAVLIDNSQSMALGKPARYVRAVEYIADHNAEVRELAAKFNLDFYLLGSQISRIDPHTLTKAPVNAESTDYLEAFSALALEYPTDTLKGALLISDGVDNGAAGEARREGRIDPALIEKLPHPLHVMLAGETAGVIDAAITEVIADSYGFVRNTFKVTVRVDLKGVEATSVPLVLKRGGSVVTSRDIAIIPGQQSYDVTLEFKPDRVGRFIFSVELPGFAGESIRENNRKMFSMEVIRDKIRVLQVVGHPSWDERFLRRLLKQDPNIDLISFFILRTRYDDNTIPKEELSLIPFPDVEIFDEKLHTFDLLILQNFDYRPYFGNSRSGGVTAGRLLDNIRRFVVEFGGGLVMIGGDESFSEGGYARTPIEEVLPVKLFAGQSFGSGYQDLTPFKMQLTDAGKNHPVTRLAFNPEQNEKKWKTLPELYGTNIVRGLAPDAVVLGTHPTLRAGADPLPVLAVREVGEGRVLSLLADSSWRWDFLNVGEGGSNREYINFWRNAIRWLIRNPETKLIEVGTDRPVYHLGAKATIRAEVSERDYRPVTEGSLDMTIYREGDDAPVERVIEAKIVEGSYIKEFKPTAPGYYRVTASAKGQTGFLGSDETIFEVSAGTVEFSEPGPDVGYLKRLAAETGGTFNFITDNPDMPDFETEDRYRLAAKMTLPLWDNWFILFFLVTLLGAEWFIRRRSGLR